MARYLPVGIDEFDELRTLPEGLYVDKTQLTARLAAQLLGPTPQLFLARPRRFGKTLLLSTLQAMFQCQRELFDGTWLGQDGHWDWQKRQYPVLRLSLDLRAIHTRERLVEELRELVFDLAQAAGVDISPASAPARLLARLLHALHRKHRQKVVALIDEYDTPITENMDRPDALDDVQAEMRAFYGALKSSRRYLRCTFMTGITRLALSGLFSGANHFQDVSFASEFHSLLGFTPDELRNTPDLAADLARCAPRLGCTAEEFHAILQGYYNGYRFSDQGEAVYNPYSLAMCLATLRAGARNGRWHKDNLPNGWARSGTSASLFRLWQTGRFTADLADNPHRDALQWLDQAELDAACPDRDILLYHAGYLTLKSNPQGRFYLDFPNQEVRCTFENSLTQWQRDRIRAWHRTELAAGHPGGQPIRDALLRSDEQALQAHIDHFMQQNPYPLYALPAPAKHLYNYETHYRGALFHILWAMGLSLQIESATTRGRTDIVIQEPRRIFILECKLGGTAAQALHQIWDKGYADPYRALGQAVVAFGLNFDTGLRTITDIAKWDLGTYDLDRGRWQREPLALCTLTALSRMDAAQRARILDAEENSCPEDSAAAVTDPSS